MSTTVETADTGDGRRTRQASGSYEIDATRTRVEVGVRLAGLPVWGTFTAIDGELEVPSDLMAARARINIDASQFSGGSRRRDRVASTVLDSDGHPAIRFEADRMEPILESFVTHDGDRPLWALVGTLTMCGVTQPVRIAVGMVRSTDDGRTVEFAATTTVRCSDFGLGRRSRLLADVVRVRISGVADRDGG